MFGHDTNQDENQDNGHYEGPNQEITAAQTVTPQVTHASPAGDDSAPHPSDAPAAVDNHELIHTAYEAAKKIANEKERAQALLDIVNEINYFTQHAQ
jgi:hypothetical protein